MNFQWNASEAKFVFWRRKKLKRKKNYLKKKGHYLQTFVKNTTHKRTQWSQKHNR